MQEDTDSALRETFLDFFSTIEDPRIDRCKLHPIPEILLLTLAAVISGAEGWIDIERYGHLKIDFLRRFFSYENGIPSDDTLRRFFRRVDPKVFQKRFVEWVKCLSSADEESLISIDGKVSRRSFDTNQKALHMVSAFASECGLILAQTKVSGKSNEITAIPELLELLDLQGSIVTIDAMGCQKEIAKHIIEKEGNYVFSLKGNQGTLHDDVKALFKSFPALRELKVEEYKTVDSDHGRIEERIYRVINIPRVFTKKHDWAGLSTLVEVSSKQEIKGIVQNEKRYYISSLPKDAQKLGRVIRSHWAIENTLHWIMDVSFHDDESRIRKGFAPENMAVIKHAALNLLQKNKGKRDSIKQLRKIAGWDNERLYQILKQQF
jgi:predicted transposase YbfD/YdcC